MADHLLSSSIITQPCRSSGSSVRLTPTAAGSHFFLDQFDKEGPDDSNVANQVLAENSLDLCEKLMDAPTGAAVIARPTAACERKLDTKTEDMSAQLGTL